MNYLIDQIVDEIGEDKLVIFSQYESVIYLLENRVKKLAKYKSGEWGYVYACNPVRRHVRGQYYKDLKILETAFQEDPSIKLWMGTMKTGGEGITLTAAHRLIRIDRWWNRPAHDQVDGRVDRFGQAEVPIIVDLEAEDTIEQWIEELIVEKEGDSNAVIRNDKI